MAALALQWQGWVFQKRPHGLHRQKIFTVWPFIPKICWTILDPQSYFFPYIVHLKYYDHLSQGLEILWSPLLGMCTPTAQELPTQPPTPWYSGLLVSLPRFPNAEWAPPLASCVPTRLGSRPPSSEHILFSFVWPLLYLLWWRCRALLTVGNAHAREMHAIWI